MSSNLARGGVCEFFCLFVRQRGVRETTLVLGQIVVAFDSGLVDTRAIGHFSVRLETARLLGRICATC